MEAQALPVSMSSCTGPNKSTTFSKPPPWIDYMVAAHFPCLGAATAIENLGYAAVGPAD